MAAKDIEAGRAHVLIRLRDQVSAGLKKTERNFAKFGRSFATAGLALGAAAGGPLVRVMQVFGGFDAAMARVSAITNGTTDELAKLRAEAKRLGATTQFSATQAAEGMVFLGMAGFNTQQVLAGIGPVLNVAAAGMLELGRAADIVSDATTAFGLAAEDTGRVADVMAKTATSSNTSIEQMGEAFTYAAAQGKAAGQTIEDVSAALGVLGNSGLKASIAGTGVQGIFKRLVQPDALAMLRSMGVSLADSAGNIRPLTALMADLQRATSRMTQLKKLQTFEELFGLHSKSAIILSDNASALEQLTGKLYNATGAADSMASKMQDSVMGRWLGFTSAFEAIHVALGEAFKGPTQSVLAFGATSMRVIAAFIDGNQTLFKTIGLIAGGIAAVGIVLTTIGFSFLAASFAVGGLATAISFLASIIGFVFSPLGLAVAVLIGLGIAAYQFRSQLAAAFSSVAEYFRPLIDGIGHVWEIFSETFGAIVAELQGGNLGNAAGIAWLGFVAAAWQGVAELGGAIDAALGFLQAWIPGVDNVRTYITGAFASIGQSILAGRWDLAGAIAMTKLKLAVAHGWGAITNVWAGAMTGIGTIWDFTIYGLRSTWNALATAIRASVFIITDVFTSIIDRLDQLWTSFASTAARIDAWMTGSKMHSNLADKYTSDFAARTAARKAASDKERAAIGRSQREGQARIDSDLNRRVTGRVQSEQGVNNRNQARQSQLRAEIANLERQAATAYAGAGAPTIENVAAKAREDLRQAIADSQKQAQAGTQGNGPTNAALRRQAGVGGGQLAKITSSGTFSAAAAAQALGFDTRPAEQTAKNTKKIVQLIQNNRGGALFT
ncbi:phage tail tape measure protein [Aureliella helgolandensis]|uniref:Phage-related minor tail protein n=1 Tax=Aureliella helgolandensis TaxID=2527968 RepID=A0A518GEF8_9BACT|nr:phage tail tape measure protein [Aureliella helgolandensis]QDV26940.1 Phage-related minor tail protein [Aureliella helgolandensis]